MGGVVVRSRFAKIIRIVSYKRKANVLVILLGYSLGVELDEHGISNAVSLTMKWSQLCNSAFGGAQLYGVCRLQLLACSKKYLDARNGIVDCFTQCGRSVVDFIKLFQDEGLRLARSEAINNLFNSLHGAG